MLPKTMVLTLSVINFTGRPFLHPTFTDARGITSHITEYKIHISYSENHDSTLMLSSIIFTCHPFQPSSNTLLRVGNTLLISSPFDVTKLQNNALMSHRLAAFYSQCQWTRIFFTTPMAMGTKLGFKWHRESHYSTQCSRKLWFLHYYQ